MPVKIRPPGTPLPDDHPLKRGAVAFSISRTRPKPTTTPPSEPPTKDEPPSDSDEPNLLEIAFDQIAEAARASGRTVAEKEHESDSGRSKVTFVPRRATKRPGSEEGGGVMDVALPLSRSRSG